MRTVGLILKADLGNVVVVGQWRVRGQGGPLQ